MMRVIVRLPLTELETGHVLPLASSAQAETLTLCAGSQHPVNIEISTTIDAHLHSQAARIGQQDLAAEPSLHRQLVCHTNHTHYIYGKCKRCTAESACIL